MSNRKVLGIFAFSLLIVGFGFSLVPLIQTLKPTATTIENARLNIDISKIALGTYQEIPWLGKPVVVFRPNKTSFMELEELNDEVWGKAISKNDKTRVYVYEAKSTSSGCKLIDNKYLPSVFTNQPTGWYDLCRMGMWDVAGRAFKVRMLPEGEKVKGLKAVKFSIVSDSMIQLYP